MTVIGFFLIVFFVLSILGQPSPKKRRRYPRRLHVRPRYPRKVTARESKAADAGRADLVSALRHLGYSIAEVTAACDAATGGSFDERLKSALVHATKS